MRTTKEHRQLQALWERSVGRSRVERTAARRSSWCSHAVAAVGAYGIFRVGLAGDDAGVHVVAGAAVAVRALAQGVRVHFLELRALLHREESAGLLALTPEALLRETRVRNFVMDCNVNISIS